MGVNEELLQNVNGYIENLFRLSDPVLEQCLEDADAAGLPPIQISSGHGKLLQLIARISGARRILEIGTLGGYSAIWLARALPVGGKLVTIEISAAHAEVARKNLRRAGLEGVVEIRLGNAVEVLAAMRGEPPFDLIFIDADKPGYVKYLDLAMKLARSGTVILADNLIWEGAVMEEMPEDVNARAARAFNLAIAGRPELDSTILPLFKEKLDGMSISVVR